MGAAPALKEDRDPILRLIESPQDLPSLPAILAELQNILNDPNSRSMDVKGVIEKDPSMTSAVLKLINSAYYAIPGGVSNLQRAIAYLGYNAIYQIALAVSALKTFKCTDFPGFKLGDFWLHSLAVAAYADEVAKAVKFSKAADVSTAGLLHDLGKIFIAKHDPDRLRKIVEHCAEKKINFYEAEKQFLPLHHTQIGEALAAHWRLPRGIWFCMKFHHDWDLTKRTGAVDEENRMVDIVIVANYLAHEKQLGGSGYPSSASLKPDSVITRLQISETQVNDIHGAVAERMKAASVFLSLL